MAEVVNLPCITRLDIACERRRAAEDRARWLARKQQSLAIRPAIDADKHFCNTLDCLKAWLDGPDAVAARTAKREARNAQFKMRADHPCPTGKL